MKKMIKVLKFGVKRMVNGRYKCVMKDGNIHEFLIKKWQFLEEKYGLNYEQISDLIKGMLKLTLNHKVSTPFGPY
jgi:nickel-dependent lactate racemase